MSDDLTMEDMLRWLDEQQGYELAVPFGRMDAVLLMGDLYKIRRSYTGAVDTAETRSALRAALNARCAVAVHVGLLRVREARP